VVSCSSSPETKSGVFSLVAKEEKWFVFTRHRRRKVVCLHSSPKEKNGVSSFITNDRSLRHHQRRNTSVSSYIMNCGTWVSSLITNKGKMACLRLSPTMEQRCVRPLTMEKQWCVFVYHQQRTNVVSACHEGRKEQKDPDIIICHWNITWSVNTILLFRNHTRCFASLDPSAGVYRPEIYRRRSNLETRTQKEEEATRARGEFGGWRSMAQKGGGGWDLDASARKNNNKSYVIKQCGQCWDVRG
jgi:hypothetical protein